MDGLFDPGRYLHQWQAWAQRELLRPLFLVVEKILGKDEPLRNLACLRHDRIRLLNLVNGLFVDGAHEQTMDDVYARFIGRRISFDELVASRRN